MRFYEFSVNKCPMIDRGQEMLNDWFLSEEGRNIRESTEFDAEATEFRDFANLHQSDIYQLTIGQKYYPITILASPGAKSLIIELSEQPVVYLGINDNSQFEFQGPTIEYKVPTNVEILNDMGHHFMSTTVYTTIQDRDQFLTLIYSKFGGRWRITKKKAIV